MQRNKYFCCASVSGSTNLTIQLVYLPKSTLTGTCPVGKFLHRDSHTALPTRCTMGRAEQCPDGYSCQSYLPNAAQGFCCTSSCECVLFKNPQLVPSVNRTHCSCLSGRGRVCGRRALPAAKGVYYGIVCWMSERIHMQVCNYVLHAPSGWSSAKHCLQVADFHCRRILLQNWLLRAACHYRFAFISFCIGCSLVYEG